MIIIWSNSFSSFSVEYNTHFLVVTLYALRSALLSISEWTTYGRKRACIPLKHSLISCHHMELHWNSHFACCSPILAYLDPDPILLLRTCARNHREHIPSWIKQHFAPEIFVRTLTSCTESFIYVLHWSVAWNENLLYKSRHCIFKARLQSYMRCYLGCRMKWVVRFTLRPYYLSGNEHPVCIW